MLFEALCQLLQDRHIRTIYLIHEPHRKKEVRLFAQKLFDNGIIPFIAHDFRILGEDAVSWIISKCDMSLLVAYDLETIKKGESLGVPFIDLSDVSLNI